MFNKFQRICIDITEGIELPEKLLATFFVCGKNEKSGLVQNRIACLLWFITLCINFK
jgi:hypothetical protein